MGFIKNFTSVDNYKEGVMGMRKVGCLKIFQEVCKSFAFFIDTYFQSCYSNKGALSTGLLKQTC